jgi:hypothetical protein
LCGLPFGGALSVPLGVVGTVGGSLYGSYQGRIVAESAAKQFSFGDFTLTPEALEIYFNNFIRNVGNAKL